MSHKSLGSLSPGKISHSSDTLLDHRAGEMKIRDKHGPMMGRTPEDRLWVCVWGGGLSLNIFIYSSF